MEAAVSIHKYGGWWWGLGGDGDKYRLQNHLRGLSASIPEGISLCQRCIPTEGSIFDPTVFILHGRTEDITTNRAKNLSHEL